MLTIFFRPHAFSIADTMPNDKHFIISYRIIHKYMRHPRLMKFEQNNIHENCLFSNVASISLAYFFNSLRPALKYLI
jgi:hypothetical protein